jgi:hypothetical protein
VGRVLDSPGRPLDNHTRSFMESRFGHDFGGVRVHSDSQAAQSARDVDAHAYTVGQDIVFDHGNYAPDTEQGKWLLAHELAHTIQQRGLQRKSIDGIEAAGNSGLERRLEREADAAANAVTRTGATGAARFTPAPHPLISREKRQWGSLGTSLGKSPKTGKQFSRVMVSFLGGVSYISAKQNSPVKDAEGKPSSVAFYVDKLFLPAGKAKALSRYQQLATAGALEAKFHSSGNLPSIKPGRPSNLAQLWSQKHQWPDNNVGELWHAAGGNPAPTTPPTTVAPGVMTDFPRVGAGKSCEVDHIVELQLGGTNLADNFEMLDSNINQYAGWEFFREQLAIIARYIRDEILGDGYRPDLILHFASAEVLNQGPAPGPCSPSLASTISRGRANFCWQIECCADSAWNYASPTLKRTESPLDKPPTAGGRYRLATTTGTAEIISEVRGASDQNIDLSAPPKGTFNAASRALIAGLELRELVILSAKNRKAGRDKLQAVIDWGSQTRTAQALSGLASKGQLIPLTFNAKPTTPPTTDANGYPIEEGQVELATKRKEVKFQYPWLSPVSLFVTQSAPGAPLTGTGKIKPTVPFLPTLDIAWDKDSLRVTKGLDEASLKKKSFLGAKITKAEIGIALLPDFKPEGIIEFQMGQGKTPFATGSLKVGADEKGLIAQGKIKLALPKIDTAEADITYRAGGGRDEWDANILVESRQINVPYITGGSLTGRLTKNAVLFDGKVDLTLPGDRGTAQLGLRREGGAWILYGKGKFNHPKLDDTRVEISYNTATETLIATGSTGFEIKSIKLRGNLEKLTFTMTKGGSIKVAGIGSLKFAKGKAAGEARVELHPNGKFTGKGSLTYKIKENIVVTGGVELDEKEKLRITGELLITRYEIFREYKDKKDIFTIDFPIPVPGLSIGSAGVVFHVRGGVGAEWSFGPGTLEPLKFSAGFDPLEEDPDLELAVTGSVKVPAAATLSAWISGSAAVQIDVGIASAGVEGGLKLQGDLILKAGAFANFDAAYKKKKLSAKLVAGIDSKLLLGITLSAFVRAWAGAFGLTAETRKDWTLAKRTIDTRLGFYISAPFEYADDTGVKLPEFKDITLKKPEVTADNMKRILGEIFGQSAEKETKS